MTFEEARAQLGLETQRQWNERAIERTTPALWGLFSLIVVLAQALHPTGGLPLAQAVRTYAVEAPSRSATGVVGVQGWFSAP